MKSRSNTKLWIIAAGFIFLFACEKLEEGIPEKTYIQPIKIGLVGDISAMRETVENIHFGAQLAAEEINSKGGLTINGEQREIQLIYKNSANNPSIAENTVYELLLEDINILIGPTFSNVAVPMADNCLKNDMLMMGYAATVPYLTEIDTKDLIWRTCPSDAIFGKLSAQYAYNNLEKRKAGILYRDDTFGQTLASIIEEQFVEDGGEVVSKVSFEDASGTDGLDVTQELEDLLLHQPDILFAVIFNEEIGNITYGLYNNDRYQDYEEKPPLFVNDGVQPQELILNGENDVVQTVIGITSNPDSENNSLFNQNYLVRYGFENYVFCAHAYDAVYTLAYAMQRAESTDPLLLREHLRAVSGSDESISNYQKINVNEFSKAKSILLDGGNVNYSGASGNIRFDQNGDPQPNIIIWRITDNEYDVVEELNY